MIPPEDVPLIGTTSKVLVRSDLHPEIVQLLLKTMVETHSRPEIFQRAGEFPNSTDAEYPVAQTAIDYYRNDHPSCSGITPVAIRPRPTGDCSAGDCRHRRAAVPLSSPAL